MKKVILFKVKINQKATCMSNLPWSNNIDDIIIPCKLCSEQAVSVSGGKYCLDCYREILTNTILGLYPVTGKDVIDRLFKNG